MGGYGKRSTNRGTLRRSITPHKPKRTTHLTLNRGNIIDGMGGLYSLGQAKELLSLGLAETSCQGVLKALGIKETAQK